jgi:hypothetical protein
MIGEAEGTALRMLIYVRMLSGRGYSEHPGYVGGFVVLTLIVLLYFGLMGYLITTLLLALYQPRKGRYSYPLASFALYVIHSTPLLYLAPSDGGKHNIPIQIGGACVVFAVTFAGDRMRVSNWATNETVWKGISIFQ